MKPNFQTIDSSFIIITSPNSHGIILQKNDQTYNTLGQKKLSQHPQNLFSTICIEIGLFFTILVRHIGSAILDLKRLEFRLQCYVRVNT